MDLSEHFSKIVSSCASFRKRDFLCDTVLLVGNKQFKAHSVILAAASTFFQSVFKQYQQPEMYYIRLPGVDTQMMPIILDYIYTGKLILPYKNEEECKLPPALFESFLTFGIDLTNHQEFIVDYQKEDENKDEPEDKNTIESINMEGLSEVKVVEMNESDMAEEMKLDESNGGEEGKVVDDKGNMLVIKDDDGSVYVDDGTKKLWLCQTCNKTFSKKSSYDKHMQFHAEDTKPNLCELCGLAITGKVEMQQHLATVHSKHPKSEWHLCNQCGKTFSKESTLMYHVMKAHAGNSSTSFRPDAEKEVYICEFCNKQYSSRTSIKLHTVMAHSETKPYQCAECGKGFAFKSQMIQHTRMHTGEKPFECQTCGKTFSAMLNLVQHNRIHTGERPFECSFCGNRFSQRSHLQTHVRTHTGEKPYVCQLCSKSYKNRLDLRIHCLRIHQINIKLREPNFSNNNNNNNSKLFKQ